MKFTIAIIGRRNVGKSTLFNRMTATRDALITNTPGLTRDRQYGYVINTNKNIRIIDTAGMTFDKNTLDEKILHQTLIAIQESNLILFMVNYHDGIMSEDVEIAKKIRTYQKKIIVVPNKIDNVNLNYEHFEFYALGFKNVHSISALYGNKVKSLLERYIYSIQLYNKKFNNLTEKKLFSTDTKKNKDNYVNNDPIKIIIIGKPNVGKSTLINSYIASERLITDNIPGTTRDSIWVPFQSHKKDFIFIDTAGIIKKYKNNYIDKISINKTFQNMKYTNIVILVIDAKNNISNHDLTLCDFIIKSGKAMIIAINKCDLLTKKEKNILQDNINFKLKFAKFINIYFISAKYKIGLKSLIKSIHNIHHVSIKKINSSLLTKTMLSAIKNQQPPIMNGNKIKLKYAHVGGYQPLKIIIHGKKTQYLKDNYKKYLKNYFQKFFKIKGNPILLYFKNS